MPLFKHENINFHYIDEGTGYPLVFLHGLGGSVEQIKDFTNELKNIRLISFDFRGHGNTKAEMDGNSISMRNFSKDLLALVEHLQLKRFNLGGISLGAAISKRFTLDYPKLVNKLILVRPAWISNPNPKNLLVLKSIGKFIELNGVEEGQKLFMEAPKFRTARKKSEFYAKSLIGQFTRNQASETYILLKTLSEDAPIKSIDELRTINIPTLVIASENDPLHPLSFGRTIAAYIQLSSFRKVTSKYEHPETHKIEAIGHIRSFIN